MTPKMMMKVKRTPMMMMNIPKGEMKRRAW